MRARVAVMRSHAPFGGGAFVCLMSPQKSGRRKESNMLTKTRPVLEPLQRMREVLPSNCLSTFELMIGLLPIPSDQPECANAISNLAECLTEYADGIAHCRPEFQALVTDAKFIAESARLHRHDVEGIHPKIQMEGRLSQFPAWALLTQLTEEQVPLRIALGAEIARALIERSQVKDQYCIQLRKGALQYGRPPLGTFPSMEDLGTQSFGKGWLGRFKKIDRQVRRRVEICDPEGPPRPDHTQPKSRLDILARLRWRFEYPDPKHRQGTLDDSHLTTPQFSRATLNIRGRVEASAPVGVLQAICTLVRITPDLAHGLPLVSVSAPLKILGLDIGRGALILDLRALFPDGRRPTDLTAALFHTSTDLLTIPLPTFLSAELKRRLAQHRGAIVLGDLVDWVHVDHTAPLTVDEDAKLRSSLARASKSTAAMVIEAGGDRLLASAISWDFSLIGSARMYYARLTKQEIFDGCTNLFRMAGWGEPAMDSGSIEDIGSKCVLTDESLSKIFRELSNACRKSWPGRRSKLSTLLEHHRHFTIFNVALVSFTLGLREASAYHLLSRDFLHEQELVTVHDKQGGDQLMAQPSKINQLVRQQIRQYLAHCTALLARLLALDDPAAESMIEALRGILGGTGPLFVVRGPRGGIRAAGSANTWGVFPTSIRVPANVGRHFWQNKLREKGLASRDVDRFMRHRVVGLENNTNSQLSIAHSSFNRIEQVQLSVLADLGIEVISGLRKA